MTPQACRSCQAPVIWAQHESTEKPAPIDAAVNRLGTAIFWIFIGMSLRHALALFAELFGKIMEEL